MPAGQSRFGWLDWTVVVGYFIGITLYGLWVSRKTRTAGAYFLGDRKLPWWVMLGQAFSTGTHAEGPVLQAGATYAYGFAAIWYQWKNMLITPFYWLIVPWYRRSERTTVAEIIDDLRAGKEVPIGPQTGRLCSAPEGGPQTCLEVPARTPAQPSGEEA